MALKRKRITTPSADDDGGDFGQEQAVLQQVVQHVKAPVEIRSAYQAAEC